MSTHSVIPASGQAEIVIPHGNLVLVADYTREGNDLILTGPDGTVVAVTGYFSGALLPSLVSAHGTTMHGDIIAKLAGEELPTAQFGPDLSAPIGVADEIEGMVTATPPGGVAVELAAGDPVYQDWLIETDGMGSAGITLNDGTKIGLSQNGRLLLDEFVFDPTTEAGSTVLTVLKGMFAAVTGRLGETSPDNVQIQTLNGTVGIRGTTFVIEVGEIGEVEFTVMEGRIVVTLPDGRVFELSQPGDSLSVDNTGETFLCEGSEEFLEQMNSDPPVREALARAQALAGDISGPGADGGADGTGGGGEASCVRFISGAGTGFQIDLTPMDGLSVQTFQVQPEALGDQVGGEHVAGLFTVQPEAPGDQPSSPPQDTGVDRRDDVNVAPEFGAPSYDLSLAENQDGSGTGVVLGLESASDPNPDDTVRYAIVNGNDAGLFRIDELTGELEYVGTGEDFEDGPTSHVLTVRATDDDGLSAEVPVTVTVTDVNEAPTFGAPEFGTPSYDFSLSENQDGRGTGVALGTVSASDPDAGDSVRYAIVDGNDTGLFRIDAQTGALEYVGPGEDFEDGPASHALTVRATDDDALSTEVPVMVTVTDVNEAPAFGAPSYDFSLAENQDGRGTGVALGTVSASDPDEGAAVRYAIVDGNDAGLFRIDAQTGELEYTGSGENFEGGPASHALTVRATDDDGLSTEVPVTVTVTDVNEAPAFEASSYAFSLAENQNGSGTGVALGAVSANDPDAGDTVRYAIVGGNAVGLFRIDEQTGELEYTGSGEDFEGGPTSRALTVRATDAQGVSADVGVTVRITDVPESPPVFDPTDYTFSLAESQDGRRSGIEIGTVSASDPDGDVTLRYTIVDGNDAGLFRIGSTSGVLEYVGAGEDFEGGPTSHTLIVEARDPERLSTNPNATVTVDVTAVNEAPEFGASSYTFSLEENQAAIAFGPPVTATDPEGAAVTFEIVGGNDDMLFDIGSTSGVLEYVGTGEDFENGPTSHTLTVQATDDGGRSEKVSVTVEIKDLDDEAPEFVESSYDFRLRENRDGSEAPIELGRVRATDPDAGSTVSYSIVGGNTAGLFQIDEQSGLLEYVGTGENFEGTKRYELMVQATDGSQNANPNATVTIDIDDVTEEPPRFVEDSYNLEFFGKWEANAPVPFTRYSIYDGILEIARFTESQTTRADDENIIWYFLAPPDSTAGAPLKMVVDDDDPNFEQPLTFDIIDITDENGVSRDDYFEISDQGVLRYTENLPQHQDPFSYTMTVTVTDTNNKGDSVELTIVVDETSRSSGSPPRPPEFREEEVVPAPLLSDGYTATPAPDAQPALGASAIEMV